MKTCSKCKIKKDPSEFHVRNTGYLQSRCKECTKTAWSENNEKYRQNPENKKRKKYLTFKRKYGINPEDYDQMIIQQNSSCACCGKQPEKLCIDHCHSTGRIRALLCVSCNFAIGYAQDSIEILENMVKYLKKYDSADAHNRTIS